MESALLEQTGSRRLVAGWLMLALAAFALSTLCAVLLVAARTPVLGTLAASGELFSRALVLHVTYAVVVWFLCCAAGFWALAGGMADAGRRTAMALSGLGLAAMILPLFSGAARPVLANYVPVLDHPVFLAGLALFIAGIALGAITSMRDTMRRLQEGQAWRLGALLSMLVMLAAVAALAASLTQTGFPSGPDSFEALAWGPGHLLQFVHVLLLMSVWTVLGESVFGKPAASGRVLAALLLLAAVPVLAAPAIYAAYPVGSIGFRRAFTLLMAWGAWPAAALLALALLAKMARAGRGILNAPQASALLFSILLFLLGCVLGSLIRGDSTMVPAHYHGTVGAVTLAYMALGYRLLPAFGRPGDGNSLERLQPVLYGAGLMILALALAWSGWIGVPRKTPHAEVMLQYPAYFAAMGLAGLGGMLAIGGAALFVFNIVRRLRTGTPARRDVRLQAFALTVLLTLGGGLLFAGWTKEQGTVTSAGSAAVKNPQEHVRQKRDEEVAREFAEGVRLLSAKQYEEASSALHRVLELAPQMPEAHVNMGFAMIGLGKHEMARDFFEAAISLRSTQMNAYYGLAIALEGIGDLEGALGAMRTFAHRMDAGDPFLAKANAAIAQWESRLGKERFASPPPTAAIPENGKPDVRYPIPEKKLN
ncbi:hypothetical protein EGT07_15555 [Herbaspirillum sp. HC18]|nr:hypothetical protein EGT07_15555 [Herbaspirillum sp. HC18]